MSDLSRARDSVVCERMKCETYSKATDGNELVEMLAFPRVRFTVGYASASVSYSLELITHTYQVYLHNREISKNQE